MEAMFVSPPPPAHGSSPKTINHSAKGRETEFAPTLKEAINEQNSSSPKSSDAEDSSQTSQTTSQALKSDPEGKREEEQALSEDAAVLGSVNGETASERRNSASPQPPLPSHSSETARIAVNISSYIKDLKDGQKLTGEAISKLLTSSPKEAGQEISPKDIQHILKTGELAAGNNEKLRLSAEQITNKVSGKQVSSIQLQANDSVTISPSKPQLSELSGHKFTPTSIHEALALRGNGRFGQAGNMSVNGLSDYTTQNPGHFNTLSQDNLPLSAEKIAARITDMVFQQNPQNTGLRDGNQSLRQDWLGEFIEAKVDQFQGKSGSKTGQEFLSSEGEMAANNSSLASAKGGEKAGEATFSQTLHAAATGKQATTGAELQRPGATNIMLSHFQENDILHQVIHKIRLTQHMQDSKLVMKLHPAELGNLKIDIHLKEGSINANILAQSQQVQEILERNMPRLRALMEEQGLKVNEITINLDNDPAEKRNHFDEHLAQDNNGFASQHNNTSNSKFVLEADESEKPEVATTPRQSGVNVLI